jgi:hypothetical protein
MRSAATPEVVWYRLHVCADDRPNTPVLNKNWRLFVRPNEKPFEPKLMPFVL